MSRSLKTVLLIVLALGFLMWLYLAFSDIAPRERDTLIPFGGATLLPVPPILEEDDEDERYEKNLAFNTSLLDYVEQLNRRERDPDRDDDDHEDERYEASIAIINAGDNNLDEGYPNFFNNEREDEEKKGEAELPRTTTPEPVIPQEPNVTPLPSSQNIQDTVRSGKGGGGFIVYEAGNVIISEIAWMGTSESASFEWIELHNTTDREVILAHFTLARGDGTILIGEKGDAFDVNHRIAPGGYFLLERNEKATGVGADKIYDGTLNNKGERLLLKDGALNVIDALDMSAGWKAGSNEIHPQGYKPTMSIFGSPTSKNAWDHGVPTPRRPNERPPLVESESGEEEEQKGEVAEGREEDEEAPVAYEFGVVLINEIAWMGDERSALNEWIELYNTSTSTIDLSGWTLFAKDNTPSIALAGSIAANGYFLLERANDSALEDIAADLIYTGALNNEGEVLILQDPAGNEIDRVQGWLAGDNGTKKTMQRLGETWVSAFAAPKGVTKEEPLPIDEAIVYQAHDIIINEIAWMGTKASASDEWIELLNNASSTIDLAGWTIAIDNANSSSTIALEGFISPTAYFLLERSNDESVNGVNADLIYTGAMANEGARLILTDPTGKEIDRVGEAGSSWEAGETIEKRSMERSSDFASWYSFEGEGSTLNDEPITDVLGNPVLGTPGCANSRELDTCAFFLEKSDII